MGKVFQIIREIYYGIKFYYGKFDDRVYSSENILKFIHAAKRKRPGGIVMYLFYHGIKKRRHYKPVNVKQFQRDKKIFEDFYSNPKLFKSAQEFKVGDWVTIVGGGMHPVRGKMYYEYYVNGYGVDECKTFRVKEIYSDNEITGYNMWMAYPFEILRPARPVEIAKAKEHYLHEMQESITNMRESMDRQVEGIREKYSFVND